jgi:hypothetical protein
MVTSDHPQVSATLHARLRHFPRHTPGPIDLAFAFGCVPDRDHLVRRPRKAARPVYEPPIGKVVYSDAADQLYIDYDGRVRALCDLGQGRALVSGL